LYRALYEFGFASQPESVGRDDGLTLTNAWVTAPLRCAPPQNKPLPAERDNCARWFHRELDLLDSAVVYVTLGRYAFVSLWHYMADSVALPRPRPMFAHGEEISLVDGRTILTSFHPSQQNTFTRRLTREMFAGVFERARDLTGLRRADP
jgi:uracil-DNA glycosylase family 4